MRRLVWLKPRVCGTLVAEDKVGQRVRKKWVESRSH